jgi:hypothetical protein
MTIIENIVEVTFEDLNKGMSERGWNEFINFIEDKGLKNITTDNGIDAIEVSPKEKMRFLVKVTID